MYCISILLFHSEREHLSQRSRLGEGWLGYYCVWGERYALCVEIKGTTRPPSHHWSGVTACRGLMHPII